jgi:hypothetical protein
MNEAVDPVPVEIIHRILRALHSMGFVRIS